MSELTTPINKTPLTLVSDTLQNLGVHSETLYYELNFKTTKAALPGFINKIRKNKSEMDLDLSCMLYDAQCQLIDTVWFKALRDHSEAVRHQGDSLNGKDRGKQAEYEGPVDPEQINICLSELPKSVSHISLVLTSYYGQPIRHIHAGNLQLSDDEGNIAFELDLTTLSDDTDGLWVADLRREVDDWHLTVHNLPTTNNRIPDISRFISRELSRSLPTASNLVKTAPK